MKRFFGLMFLTALACLALAQTTTETFNSYLQLPVFEGSTLVDMTEDADGDSEVVFTADADLQTIFDFYDQQMVAAGWTQTELETSADEIEGNYTRDGVEAELELELRQDGSFKLDVDIDDA